MAKGSLLSILMALAFAVSVGMAMSAKAPAIAPAPAVPTCEDLVTENLPTCLTYVILGSNDTKPDKDCCKGFSTLVGTQPKCLCQLLGNATLTEGFPVNRTRALGLGGACGVRTPPLSSCSALGVPIASPPAALPPGVSPAEAPSDSPALAPAPAPASFDSVCQDLAFNDLVNCLDFLLDGSNETKTTNECCTGFSSIIQTEPLCLCDLISENSTIADDIGINITKALLLPGLCRVATPPINLCSAVGYKLPPGLAPVSSAPVDECTKVVAPKLVACLSYVEKNSTKKKPDSRCCTGFSSLVTTRPDCLCKLLANSSSIIPGFPFDSGRELMIPKACGVQIPPLDACSAFGYQAPASAPSVETECERLALTHLVPCLSYVNNGSKLSKPDKGCCSGFSNITNDRPICLCDLLSTNSTLTDTLQISRTRALHLPDMCRVQIPPVSLCSAAGFPLGNLALAPAPSGDKCTGVLVDKLGACISFVEKGSNVTKPSEKCCSGFSTLFDASPNCVCELIAKPGSALPGFAYDQDKAIELADGCKIDIQTILRTCSSGGTSSPAPSGLAGVPPQSSSPIRGFGCLFDVLLLLASLAVALLSAF